MNIQKCRNRNQIGNIRKECQANQLDKTLVVCMLLFQDHQLLTTMDLQWLGHLLAKDLLLLATKDLQWLFLLATGLQLLATKDLQLLGHLLAKDLLLLATMDPQ